MKNTLRNLVLGGAFLLGCASSELPPVKEPVTLDETRTRKFRSESTMQIDEAGEETRVVDGKEHIYGPQCGLKFDFVNV